MSEYDNQKIKENVPSIHLEIERNGENADDDRSNDENNLVL